MLVEAEDLILQAPQGIFVLDVFASVESVTSCAGVQSGRLRLLLCDQRIAEMRHLSGC